MKIEEFYRNTVCVVCHVTGVDNNEMLHSNREECVDARSILVNVLLCNGITEIEISMLTGLTRQCVNKLKNGFRFRLRKWSVSTNLQSISNELSTG